MWEAYCAQELSSYQRTELCDALLPAFGCCQCELFFDRSKPIVIIRSLSSDSVLFIFCSFVTPICIEWLHVWLAWERQINANILHEIEAFFILVNWSRVNKLKWRDVGEAEFRADACAGQATPDLNPAVLRARFARMDEDHDTRRIIGVGADGYHDMVRCS